MFCFVASEGQGHHDLGVSSCFAHAAAGVHGAEHWEMDAVCCIVGGNT